MMQNANDKKWFIYITDHHEGPFTAQQIEEMLETQKINISSHAWCDGMPDWTTLDQIESLSSLVKPRPQQVGPTLVSPVAPHELAQPEPAILKPVLTSFTPEPSKTTSAASPELSRQTSSAISSDTSSSTSFGSPSEVFTLSAISIEEKTSSGIAATRVEREINPHEWTKTDVKQFNMGKGIAETSDFGFEPIPKRGKTLKIVGFLLILIAAGGGGFYFWNKSNTAAAPSGTTPFASISLMGTQALSRVTESLRNIPWLAKWLSKIPTLTDLKPEDLAELRNAAGSPLSQGAAIAFALSQTDPVNPKIYLGSNLPEDTQLDIYFVGVPDSLLNQTSYFTKQTLPVKSGLGIAAQLKNPDGSAIPRGQYFIYAINGQAQPSSVQNIFMTIQPVKSGVPTSITSRLASGHIVRAFSSKVFFLGGAKDSTYSQRLAEYHDKLQEKSKQELIELRQFFSTLESQFTTTDAEFEKIRTSGKLTPIKRKSWTKFHEQFIALQGQLIQATQTFDQLIGTDSTNGFFYQSLYSDIKKTVGLINLVHAHHATYFEGPVDPKAFEETLSQLSANCAQSLQEFKDKLEKIEATPLNPGQMPMKDPV